MTTLTLDRQRQNLQSRLDAATDTRERIDLLNERAWLEREFNSKHAEALSQEAYALATSSEFANAPYARGVITALRTLGYLHMLAGLDRQSTEESLRALELLSEVSDAGLEIEVRRNLAWSVMWMGDLEPAMRYALPALGLARELGDLRREAMVLDAMGAIYGEAGEHEQANDHSLRALQLYREVGDEPGEATMLNNVACHYLQQGEYDLAMEHANTCLELARRAGLTSLYVTALGTAGETHLERGETGKALALFEEYRREAASQDLQSDQVFALLLLGTAHHRLEQPELACQFAEQALARAEVLGLRSGQYQCHELLASIYEGRGDFQAALHHYKQFHELRESVLYKSSRRLHSLPALTGLANAQRDLERYHRETLDLQQEIERRKRTEEMLHALASQDPLTGVLNRRHFLNLAEEYLRAVEPTRPLSLILFDLDHFKSINDTYGHTVGDRVLQAVAHLVRDNLRERDLIARFGGEEFIILLPETTRADAGQLAERLRERIQKKRIAHQQKFLRLTISLGVAQAPLHPPRSLLMLIQDADRALYHAKRRGRNRTIVADDNLNFSHVPTERELFPPLGLRRWT